MPEPQTAEQFVRFTTTTAPRTAAPPGDGSALYAFIWIEGRIQENT